MDWNYPNVDSWGSVKLSIGMWNASTDLPQSEIMKLSKIDLWYVQHLPQVRFDQFGTNKRAAMLSHPNLLESQILMDFGGDMVKDCEGS